MITPGSSAFDNSSVDWSTLASVADFSLLPDVLEYAGVSYLVLNATGTWLLGTKKKAGLYRSTGSEWLYMGSNVVIDDSSPSTEKAFSSQKISDQLLLKVNNSQVLTNVPVGAVFTDTPYSKPASEPINYIVNLQSTLDAKVNKVAGKVLSANDYTDLEKAKLAGTADSVNAIVQKLSKADTSIPVLEVSGATLITTQACAINTPTGIISFPLGAAVTLPALVSATDYKVYSTATGLTAQAWVDAAPADSIEIGGFHAYHTTATINPSSIWDLRWRPLCSPRGMTLSPDKSVWVDIYLMDIDYGIDGYSKGNSTIADGSSLAKIPLIYGGNGTAAYASHSWFNAIDLAVSAGKRLPFYMEFTGFAYGVVEAQSVGADPVTTKYAAGYRSACGVEQATGTLWQWGADINGTSAVGTAGWQAITEGRGSVYAGDIKAVLLGAGWGNGVNAGSRASGWGSSPSDSNGAVGSRALCDHLAL